MRKRLAVLFAVVVLVGALAMLYLKQNAVEMIHAVIVNAVIQKAPDDYPREKIRTAFQERIEAADTPEKREAYLDQLKQLSLRLEKLQYLNAQEVDQILRAINPPSSPGDKDAQNDMLR